MKNLTTILLLSFLSLLLFACDNEEILDTTIYDTNIINDDTENLNITEPISTDAWGSVSALSSDSLTIEEMLTYAIQDEFTARSEYEYIIDNFEVTNPFTNIIEAEKSHIEMILPFLQDYNIEIPIDDSSSHLIIPNELKETFEAGVEAEILNIAMYNMFLESELPDDVFDLFTALRDASLKHLSAFEKNLAKY